MSRLHNGRILAAAIAGNIIGYAGWSAQPEILSESLTTFHLNEAEAALAISAETATLALTTVFFTRLLGSQSRRGYLLLGAAIAIVGTVLSVLSGTFIQLAAARALSGIGEGIVLAVASILVASFPDPDRGYAHLNTGGILGGAAMVAVIPVAAAHIAHLPVLVVLMAVMLLLTPALYLAPAGKLDRLTVEGTDIPSSLTSRWAIRLLWISMVAFATGSAALWAFFVEFGKRTSLTRDQIDVTVSVALLAGLLGTATASLLSTRIGRLAPMLALLIALTVANMAVTQSTVSIIYQAGVCGTIACIYGLLPYYQGYATQLDRSGKAAAIVAACFVLSGATGPLIGGWIAARWGLSAIGFQIIAANSAAAGLLLGAASLAQRAFAGALPQSPIGVFPRDH
jgi:predicted MFS family arabinose efflux permease